MRCELNLISLQMKLFEQFARVTMSENGICREVIRCIHKVSFCRSCLASPANSRFRVADNSEFKIDQSCLKQRSESEDDGGRIASGVGNQTRYPNCVPVQFGTTVDSFDCSSAASLRIRILQPIDITVPRLL